MHLRSALQCVLLAVLVALLGLSVAQQPVTIEEERGRQVVFDAVVDIFKDNYWNEQHMDWDAWADRYRHEALSAESRHAFDGVLRRMVYAVGDDHSMWVGLAQLVDHPHEVPREPPQVGIGVRHTLLQGVGVVVERVFPDTPAAEAGLKRGDVIVRLNGEDVRLLDSSQQVAGLFGQAVATGEVNLRVHRNGAQETIDLTPAPIRFGEAANRPTGELLEDGVGYIFVPTFSLPNIGDEVHARVRELQGLGADRLILDLRGNLGGRIGELGLVLGAFVEGPWGQAVSRGELAWRGAYHRGESRGTSLLMGATDNRSSVSLDDPSFFDGPLAVLVDRSSSSAGEIAAHVLQDLGRAVVVGERTRGNVEAVRGFDLPDGSVVMVAVANVQALDGRTFDDGVAPDLEARAELDELARGVDAPLKLALRELKRHRTTPQNLF